jgi:hypothetical protein
MRAYKGWEIYPSTPDEHKGNKHAKYWIWRPGNPKNFTESFKFRTIKLAHYFINRYDSGNVRMVENARLGS